MPTCEPVQCDEEDSTGEMRSVASFGKRRRRRSVTSPQDDMLLEQSIQITDKFGFERDSNKSTFDNEAIYLPNDCVCINMAVLFLIVIIFVSTQFVILATWTFICKKRNVSSKLSEQLSVNGSIPSQLACRMDSFYKLYGNNYNHPHRF